MPNVSCATASFATISWCWRPVACRYGITDIEVRLARPDEEAKWRASRAKAIRQGNIEENDVGWIAFLVALTDRRNGDQSGREAHRSMAARRRVPI